MAVEVVAGGLGFPVSVEAVAVKDPGAAVVVGVLEPLDPAGGRQGSEAIDADAAVFGGIGEFEPAGGDGVYVHWFFKRKGVCIFVIWQWLYIRSDGPVLC